MIFRQSNILARSNILLSTTDTFHYTILVVSYIYAKQKQQRMHDIIS